ncbi:MAG TPA: DUF3667 domain-containing protein [Chitinophagaceae bacterium]|nr:DUF3667 domain-containing protein [Chitinophagaceae bacterium]
MSHTPGRKEKDCLNCGTIVAGRFCQNCGQENVVPKETFWHMVTHFFYDITHFDSNFFITVKDLLFKPGFLSKEYMKGKRMSYLHPVKMYVFTSAIFFLLFFSFFLDIKNISDDSQKLTPVERSNLLRRVKAGLLKDSTNKCLKDGLSVLEDTSLILTKKDVRFIDTCRNKGVYVNFAGKYKSFEAYDSSQKKLPKDERDAWFGRLWKKTTINIEKKFNENPDEALKKLIESILHRLPYMLLISLPFFALILKLVYTRRKQFYYADHGVFTIHLYVFSFLMLLLIFCFDKLSKVTHSELPDVLIFLSLLWLNVYLFKAMRTFYGQSWWKTFLKFLIVALSSLVMMILLFLLITFFSAVTL